MKLKLPIGISSFECIRSEGYYYVDKTEFVKKLFDSGKYFFLSRPRRFGKTLFLDTLKQAFLGNKELFKGLFLENNWDWGKKYPVVHIFLGSGVSKTKQELLYTFEEILIEHQKLYQVELSYPSLKGRFRELILKLYEKFNQKVVVLIDEYDKPILDNIEDVDRAIEMREILKDFYSVLKDADPYLKFVFITGVSKFSKVSLFSGLNNLYDISLNPEYATICGYTQRELESVFADRLKDVDLEEVKRWYNGYSWLGEPVYNPFDVLCFLAEKRFRPFWFETGTPSFLIKLLIQKNYYFPTLEEVKTGEEIIGSFDIDTLNPLSLLFQTGYLTIEKTEDILGKTIYFLRYPNLEVKTAFCDYLLNYFLWNEEEKVEKEIRLSEALVGGDVEGVVVVFKELFAGMPYDWYRKSVISEYEGYYASVFYAYFSALGVDVRAEDVTSRGRVDLVVILPERCYIFEFKVVEEGAEKKALAQLKEKRYYEKYRGRCREIYLVGIEFSKKERNIVYYEWERVEEKLV